MPEPRYAYMGLVGAGLLLAYNINAHRTAASAEPLEQAAPEAPAVTVEAPVVAPPPPTDTAAIAAKAAAQQAAADKAAADQAASAAKAAAAQAAADKAAAEQIAAKAAAAEKATADKAAALKAAQAKQEAAKAVAATEAAAKQAADKAKADLAAVEQATKTKAVATETAVAAATPTASGPWAGGDATAGQVVFHKCQLCHYGEEGKTKIGPSLWKVVGRHSGTLEGYHYSRAMASYDHVWTPENLFVYLQAPTKVVRGTKMTFVGLPSETDRRNVIAYLQTLK